MTVESKHDTTRNNHNDYEGNRPYVVELLALLEQHHLDIQDFKEKLEKAQAELEHLQTIKKEAERLSEKVNRLLKRSRRLILNLGEPNHDD